VFHGCDHNQHERREDAEYLGHTHDGQRMKHLLNPVMWRSVYHRFLKKSLLNTGEDF
jgi:hypothetical protein